MSETQGAPAPTAPTDLDGLDELLQDLAERTGTDYGGYEHGPLRRRVRRLLDAEALDGVAHLRARVAEDPGCRTRLQLALSLRPAPLFHQPGFFVALRREVVPLLRTYPRVRVWCPCCATGEEAYALAIVLHEEGLLPRSQIYATDPCEAALSLARRGRLAPGALLDAEASYLAAGGTSLLAAYYADLDGAVEIGPALRERISFAQHSPATDASPNEFQLVVCRGVLGDFGAALRGRALALIDESLCRLGALGLGRGEAPYLDSRRACYEPLSYDEALFRRVC